MNPRSKSREERLRKWKGSGQNGGIKNDRATDDIKSMSKYPDTRMKRTVNISESISKLFDSIHCRFKS